MPLYQPAETSVISGTVDQGAAGTDPWPVIVTAAQPLTVNNLISIPHTTSPVLLIAANATRKTLTIYNKSNANLCVKYDSGVSMSFMNFVVPPSGLWESEFFAWPGEVWGVWAAGTGVALVAEQY